MTPPPEPPGLRAWHRLVLLALASVNLWACYTALEQRLLLGLAHGALAILLLLLAAVSGPRERA